MSWLRLDDGFASNHKIAALTDRQLRVWLRVLCHCAKAQDPTVDAVVIQEVAGLDSRTIGRLAELELLDESGSSHEVHDWATYQPKDLTGAERQARWRARRNGPRNGSRNGEVTAADRDKSVTETVTSRAEARARPVPTPKDINPRPLAKGPTSPVENPQSTSPLEPAGDPDADIDFNSPPIPQRTA